MERLLNITTVLSLALIVMILGSLRRAHIRVEYSVSWLAAAVTMLVLSRWEEALVFLSHLAGITYPPAVLLSITVGVFLLVLYRFSVMISELKDNNIALAQKVAILEYELQALKGEG